jgi:hypothetical protein
LKYFKNRGFLRGDIMNFDEATGLYGVVFEDGECDEYNQKSLEKLILSAVIAKDTPSSPSSHRIKKKLVVPSPKKGSSGEKRRSGFYRSYQDGTLVEKVGGFLLASFGLMI